MYISALHANSVHNESEKMYNKLPQIIPADSVLKNL